MASYPKSYRTPQRVYPKQGTTQQRIRIAQPVYRPLGIKKKLVRKGFLRPDAWWITLHRRRQATMTRLVGEDPKEMNAIPKTQLKGTLPERTLYKALVTYMHMVSGIDFDFQSSLSGGRIELGGLVVDFIFRSRMLVIQVQGPTHTEFLRSRKDEEQRSALAEMGYTEVDLGLDVIYSPMWLENWLRRIFGFIGGNGAGTGAVTSPYGGEMMDDWDISQLYAGAIHLQDTLNYIETKLWQQ
jgi:hypothetical protein